MTKALSDLEITEFLSLHLPDWIVEKKSIKRDLKFRTFIEAFSFMTAIAFEAEKLNHHPDWSNTYNLVSISLSTHSAKGITKLDFDLASAIDKFYTAYNYTIE